MRNFFNRHSPSRRLGKVRRTDTKGIGSKTRPCQTQSVISSTRQTSPGNRHSRRWEGPEEEPTGHWEVADHDRSHPHWEGR